LIAHSTASAPEFVKNVRPADPVASASSSFTDVAAAIAGGLAKKLLTWTSVDACVAIASATTGLAWPSDVTARPHRKSR
jgi:hypothetical protein